MKKIDILLLTFLVISNICIIFFLSNYRNAYETNIKNCLISKASVDLNKLKRDSNEEFYIQQKINQFYGLLSEEKSNENIQNIVTRFKNKNNYIKLRLYDKTNNLISFKNDNDKDSVNSAMNRLYTSLATSKSKNDYSLLKRYRSLFETLLGAIDLTNLSKDTSLLIPVTLSGKPGYIYWNIYENTSTNINNIGGMLAWIRKNDIPQNNIKENLIDDYNSKQIQNIVYGFLDSNNYSYPEQINNSLYSYNEISLKIQELKSCMKNFDFIDNYLFYFIQNDINQYYFCFIKCTNNLISWLILISISILIILSSIYGFQVYLKITHYLNENNLLKKQVKNLYIICFFLNLFIILFTLYLNIMVYEMNEYNRKEYIYSNLNIAIDNFNDGYNEAKKELAEKLLSFSNSEELKILNFNELNEIVKNNVNQHIFDKIFITTTNGKILYSYPNAKDSLLSKIIPVISRKIASERLDTEESWKNKINDMMVNTVTQSFTDLLGDGANKLLKSFENCDSISEIEFGSKKHLVFSTIIKSKEPLICIMWIDDDYFCHNYLVNKIKDSQSIPDDLKRINFAMIPAHQDGLPFPMEITKFSFSRYITEQVVFYNRAITFENSFSGQKIYGIGNRLRAIPKYVIFAYQDE